ncbi:MAG TPA: tetratricopeptide repeat protein, partial [Thermoanaerobaculia bacterium]|nr:tetratricopeptide repeat protein [Thermoanaerobaculia bacterium]
WAVVAYLAWWLGERFAGSLVSPSGKGPGAGSSRRSRKAAPQRAEPAPGGVPLFAQVAWACLFLGAISWAVESAAVGAGWWHWTVPLSAGLLGNVPWIGLVDWFFVGTDFLLPFLALTAPALRSHPARFLTLLAFPIHFGSHLLTEPLAGLSRALPIPVFHLVHWALLALLLALALRPRAIDPAFASRVCPAWLTPALALALVLADVALVQLFAVGEPRFLASLAPALAVALVALFPRWTAGLGLAALAGGILFPPLLLAAVPPLAATLLRAGHRHPRGLRWALPALLALLAGAAWQVHAAADRREADLRQRLDQALAARDAGDLPRAIADLEATAKAHPGSHVPQALLAEIHYRTGRLVEARERYRSALALKQDFLPAHRHLSVIALQQEDRTEAAQAASRGLQIAPTDPELLYLKARAEGGPPLAFWKEIGSTPQVVEGLAGLAFEVNDPQGAADALQAGLSRWPGHLPFHRRRVQLALAQGDQNAARQALQAWLQASPNDAEALRLLVAQPSQ